MTRQGWCLVVLAVAAGVGGFCAAVGWFWSDEGASE